MSATMKKVWAVLIIFTIFAYLLGEFRFVNSVMVVVLLISTFIKGELVISYFMGLRNVRMRYSIIPTLWLILVLSSIAVAYYLPQQ